MPFKSEMVVYGLLSGPDLVLNSGDILFNHKIVTGFSLWHWKDWFTKEEKAAFIKEVADDYREGKNTFVNPIAAEFPMAEWEKAMEESVKLASKGKVLIVID